MTSGPFRAGTQGFGHTTPFRIIPIAPLHAAPVGAARRPYLSKPCRRCHQIHPPSLPPDAFTGKTISMSAPNDHLLQAIEMALAGKWDAAHELVQQHEGDATAAWIHAVLHKIEGDLGNARY